MKKVLRWGALAGLLIGLSACGKKLPTPPPPAPGLNDTTQTVLAEMFSTRLCQNCPRSDSALHALLENFGTRKIIAVEYHPLFFAAADSLGTPETDARKNLYGVNSYPTCFFDGLHKTVGAAGNVYDAYEDSAGLENSLRSPLVLGLTASQVGVATVQVKALGSVPSPMILQTVVIEDSVYYRGPYQSWWRFVVRDMVPDQNGDTLRMAQGDSLTRTKGFTIQSQWRLPYLYLVAFVQNPATGQVLQSARVKLVP